MRTPAGIECEFYYEDFYRGRDTQECRLVLCDPKSEPWQPRLCRTCPVPAIRRANACPDMVLEGWVGRRWLLVKRVKVSAFCKRTRQQVADPMVGCGRCHEDLWRDILSGGSTDDTTSRV